MTYNLTEKQRAFAKWIIRTISEETFFIVFPDDSFSSTRQRGRIISPSRKEYDYDDFDEGTVEALAAESLLHVASEAHAPPFAESLSMGFATTTFRKTLRCTITGKLKEAVETNFRDQTPVVLANTSVIGVPAEIVASLERFRKKFPDASGVGFLIMRFAAAKPYSRIVDVIKKTGGKHGLNLLRADEN